MRILSVSGGGSGSGKTMLVARLIGVLPGWGVIKTTPVVPGGHDHGLTESYKLVLDREQLASPGTDTRSYLDSGAHRVGWLIARPPLSTEAKGAVMAAFGDLEGLVIEGGSLADGFAPDRRYVVVRPGLPGIKPDALARVARGDAIVVTPSTLAPPSIAAFLDDVRAWARR